MNKSKYREEIIKRFNFMIGYVWYENCYEYYYISQFVKKIGLKAEDSKLVGLATLLEVKSQAVIDENSYSDEYLYPTDEEIERDSDRKEVKKICIKVFFKDKEFTVDLKKYINTIEENKEILIKTGKYDRLYRYINEEKIISKIYREIRDKLGPPYKYDKSWEIPTVKDVYKLFPAELNRIYNLADNHVESEIAKAKKELEI